MGKYKGDDIAIEDPEVSKLNILLHISNELAEANRLKRVEIEIMARSGGFTKLSDENKFMEDQA